MSDFLLFLLGLGWFWPVQEHGSAPVAKALLCGQVQQPSYCAVLGFINRLVSANFLVFLALPMLWYTVQSLVSVWSVQRSRNRAKAPRQGEISCTTAVLARHPRVGPKKSAVKSRLRCTAAHSCNLTQAEQPARQPRTPTAHPHARGAVESACGASDRCGRQLAVSQPAT